MFCEIGEKMSSEINWLTHPAAATTLIYFNNVVNENY